MIGLVFKDFELKTNIHDTGGMFVGVKGEYSENTVGRNRYIGFVVGFVLS